MTHLDTEKLEELRQNLSLAKLYHIKTDDWGRALFGVRVGSAALLDSQQIKTRIEEFLVVSGFKDVHVVVLDNPRDEITLLLEEVESYVASEGGSIEIKSIDEEKGEIVVSLTGACATCPSSLATMKMGVRRALEILPWLKNVRSDTIPEEPNFGFTL